MNRSKEIIEYLKQEGTPNTVLIAPNAPPVGRRPKEVEVALNMVLDAGDVYDTIRAFMDLAGIPEDELLSDSRTFAVPMDDVGRLRVSFTTQRGSKVATITLVPFILPPMEDMFANPEAAQDYVKLVCSNRGGLLAVTGTNTVANSTFAYAMIREANQSRRMVIYTIERALTCLLAHSESITIQSEIGSDMASINAGLENAEKFTPDLIYVEDVRPSDDITALTHAVGAGVTSIASSISMSGASLLEKIFQYGTNSSGKADLIRTAVQVTLLKDGRILLEPNE